MISLYYQKKGEIKMKIYLIYSGYHDSVLRIDLNKSNALSYAEQYTKDTSYESWVVETYLIDWWDCDDLWNDVGVIAHYTSY